MIANILVVDDHPESLEAIKAVLAPLGQRIVTARSREEALQRLSADDFAVVLFDISTPAIDGFQTQNRIRPRDRPQLVPIIFCTGVRSESRDIVRGRAGGVVDDLVTTYDADVLRSKVREFVELFLQRQTVRNLGTAVTHLEENVVDVAEREKLLSLLMHTPVAIFGTRGPTHVFDFANPYFEKLACRNDLVGKSVVEMLPSLRNTPFLTVLDGVYQTGDQFRADEFAIPLDRENTGHAEKAFFILNIEPVRNQPGTIVGLMGAALEITNHVRARWRSEQAVAARDDFIAIAAHELRSPLTTLRLQADWLLAEANARTLSSEMPRLKAMRRQTDRLDAVIAALVDSTRITGGRFELHRDTVDLGELAREVTERLGDELRRAECTPVVHSEPGVVGNWDRFRLDQVLTNLLTNAAKYGSGKPVEVRINREDHFARLVVRDHGIGIPPADQARVFERFERAASGRQFSGLGLGLWIARHIVVAHGGTIAVRSEVGSGATFIVDLPL